MLLGGFGRRWYVFRYSERSSAKYGASERVLCGCTETECYDTEERHILRASGHTEPSEAGKSTCHCLP